MTGKYLVLPLPGGPAIMRGRGIECQPVPSVVSDSASMSGGSSRETSSPPKGGDRNAARAHPRRVGVGATEHRALVAALPCGPSAPEEYAAAARPCLHPGRLPELG